MQVGRRRGEVVRDRATLVLDNRLEPDRSWVRVVDERLQMRDSSPYVLQDWVVDSVGGGRFCTPAESRYAPIEGELLGVTWALSKTSHYTLGARIC